MPSYQKALRIFVVSFVAGLALVCALNAAAQSGRRTKKTTPAPVPVASQEPTPSKAAEKAKPALTLIVGMERFDNIGYNGPNQGTVVMAACDRLNDNPAVKVEQVQRNMNRSEAIRRAKAEKEAYVVLFELETDSRTAVTVTVTDLSLQYTVFSPTTAKLKAFGRTYPQATRKGGVIVSPGSDRIYGDYKLQQAARQAAEKILDAFHLSHDGRGPWARQD
jgi:hypothetical protein